MNLRILLSMPLAALTVLPVVAQQDYFVSIACYPNTSEGRAIESRIFPALDALGIRGVSVGSAGATLNVPAADEERARRLLAEMVLHKEITVTLVKTRANGKGATVITPEEVLKEKP